MKIWNKKMIGIGFTAVMILVLSTGCSNGSGADQIPQVSQEESFVTEQSSVSESVMDNVSDTAVDDADRPYVNDGTGTIKILQEGDIAPDFTADLVDGSTFRMSEHDDQIVLLNFFATWCGPCMAEMPAFEMLKEDGYENLAILCVDCMEDVRTVDQFVQETGYTFPIAYDEKGLIEFYYPTDGIPFTLLVDHGVIRKIYIGAYGAEQQYQEYKSAIDACIQG